MIHETFARARGTVSRLVAEFVDLIEPTLGRFARGARWVAIEDGDDFALYEAIGGRPVLRARTSSIDARQERLLRRVRSGSLELRLDPERVITRTLQLPAAGRDYVEPIIEHRLERLTPWRPEKVLYGFVIGGAATDGTIAVDFAATSQDIAAQAVSRLETFNLVPTAIGAAGDALEKPLRIDLYRGRNDPGRLRLQRAAAMVLLVIALVVAPLCVASFWLVHAAESRLDATNRQLAALRGRLQAATGGEGENGRDLRLIGAKRIESSVVVLIDRVATLLPSNTYLKELEINPDGVRLVGVSENAPALIGILDADSALSEVRFSAPVTRGDDDRDRFEINATRPAVAGEVP